MSLEIRWTARAAAQLLEAAEYLEASRENVGYELVDQVEAVLTAAGENPRLFPRIPDVEQPEVRRALIRKFGYWIIFDVRSRELVVFSVWHGARQPGGWKPGR